MDGCQRDTLAEETRAEINIKGRRSSNHVRVASVLSLIKWNLLYARSCYTVASSPSGIMILPFTWWRGPVSKGIIIGRQLIFQGLFYSSIETNVGETHPETPVSSAYIERLFAGKLDHRADQRVPRFSHPLICSESPWRSQRRPS